MTDPSTTTNSAFHSKTLEDAWQRFAKYDKNAIIAQRRFIQQRKWVLSLGVAATTLAIIYSTLDNSIRGNPPFKLPPWLNQSQFLEVFHGIVIVVPIAITLLVAFSVKFNMGISWVMLRSSAEAIKKEIYRYRMQVDEYNPAKAIPSETRDVKLAFKLKLISRRLMETPVNQTDLQPYTGSLPPGSETTKGDDGFSNLTAEQYVAWRVEDQFNYYQKKAARLGKELRHFQALIISLGGVGALLAALKLDVWIAVSSALVAAFTSYLEFKRVETNVVACNLAAADLYDIRIWWHALSAEAKQQQATVETLVNSTESILQTENAGWLQEMRDALAEIYGSKKEPGQTERTRNGQKSVAATDIVSGSDIVSSSTDIKNDTAVTAAEVPTAEKPVSAPIVEATVPSAEQEDISSETEDFSGRLPDPLLTTDAPVESDTAH